MNKICSICPRNCQVDRASGQIGFCRVSNRIKVARAALHMWEEPCISGDDGSGAVFFSGCNLKCVYCQNHDISDGKTGKEISVERLAEIFLELQDKKANNINLVTPSHYVLQIIDAISSVKDRLKIPVVYNSSSYEKVETLRMLEGYVNIYLPDCKYYSNELSIKYSNAPDYFDTVLAAIKEMLRQVGKPCFDNRGMLKSGVIIRHLVLPDNIKDSKQLLNRLYSEFGDDVYFSIMSQYTPVCELDAHPELMRKITDDEYNEVVDFCIDLGIENGFIQEGDVASESFIPAFDCEGV